MFVGAALGGVLGLIAGAALGASNAAGGAQPLIVGGVDLTNVDLTRPFWVDFSVVRGAAPSMKHIALQRLRHAMNALGERFPLWIIDPQISVPEGQFVLVITPIFDPAERVARSIFSP